MTETWHILMGLIKFVVVDGKGYVNFNMIYHNGMNFTKIVTVLSELKI
jgi:hypothetical protein